MTRAKAALRAFLAEYPYGGMAFKDRLHTFEALSRAAFGTEEEKPNTTEIKDER